MQENLTNQISLGENSEKQLFGKPESYDYSKFSGLDDFDLDEELINKFYPIAEKLDLSQDAVEMLLEIALEMSRKQCAFYSKDEDTLQKINTAKYSKMIEVDDEIPSLNTIELREYMKVADTAYSDFASPQLKETFKKYGLNYHPELIKMFHKLGKLSEEDCISYQGKPVMEELSPAEILYGKKKEN